MVLDGPVDADATSTSRGATWPSSRPASNARSAASSRPARRPGGVLRLRRDDPWVAYDSSSTGPTRIRSRADGYTADPRPVDGDDLDRRRRRGLLEGVWARSARRSPRPRTARLAHPRSWSTAATAASTTASTTRSTTATSRSERREQRYPRDVGFYLDPGTRPGAIQPRVLEQRLRRAELRALAAHDRDAFTGPSRFRVGADAACGRDTYDPATPYRGALGSCATSATRG